MGYVRKNSTVANPAKKSLTVFQNSYQETYTYQSGTVPVYGQVNIQITLASGLGTSNHNIEIKNNSDIPIEWRINGKPTVTISAHAGYTRYAYAGIKPNGSHDYGDLYTQAGAHIGPANYGRGYNGNVITGYTTQYSTMWNTKWRKLSA